jgi:hypothetical protein
MWRIWRASNNASKWQMGFNLAFKRLNIVTLANSYSAPPDDGDYTETCWSCFSVNFNTPFKAILFCISW